MIQLAMIVLIFCYLFSIKQHSTVTASTTPIRNLLSTASSLDSRITSTSIPKDYFVLKRDEALKIFEKSRSNRDFKFELYRNCGFHGRTYTFSEYNYRQVNLKLLANVCEKDNIQDLIKKEQYVGGFLYSFTVSEGGLMDNVVHQEAYVGMYQPNDSTIEDIDIAYLKLGKVYNFEFPTPETITTTPLVFACPKKLQEQIQQYTAD